MERIPLFYSVIFGVVPSKSVSFDLAETQYFNDVGGTQFANVPSTPKRRTCRIEMESRRDVGVVYEFSVKAHKTDCRLGLCRILLSRPPVSRIAYAAVA